MKARWGQLLFVLIAFGFLSAGFLGSRWQSGELPIGQIQGRESVSPFLDHQVGFRGIVTGIREDQNAAGVRYYTFFVQSEAGAGDGDPLTSDGIAVFTGRSRPHTTIGDLVVVWGVVTEFYGLTEIDDKGLHYQVASRDNSLPAPIDLNPPAEFSDSEGYYEPYEGMLVKAPLAVTVGPTHSACGFSVIRQDLGTHRILTQSRAESRGDVIKVLYFSDADCDQLPALATGDRIEGIVGPLTYSFDQYKVVVQESTELRISKFDHPPVPQFREMLPGQFTIASFNLENYFDSLDDTGESAEPKPSLLEIEIKQKKLVHTIVNTLACPTIIGVQEVEKYELLTELSQRLTDTCGFTYEVSHLDTVDVRGIDMALLSNPERAVIKDFSQFQICSQIKTEVNDPAVSCAEGEEPLFARQPFTVDLEIDELPMTLIVNHFKSKRGGETETESWRITQSQALNTFSRQMQSDHNDLALVLLGDFNDFDQSPVRKALIDSGILVDALSSIPEVERYSYIFDGESQLTDWIMVSPNLSTKITEARIAHVNADYPYQLMTATVPGLIAHRSSDHDIPVVTFDLTAMDEPQPRVTTQEFTEASEPDAGSMPATPQQIVRDTNSDAKDEEQLGISTDELVAKNDDPINSARTSSDIGDQDIAFEDDSNRLLAPEFIILAVVSVCIVVIVVFALARRPDRG